MVRAPFYDKNGQKKGAWSPEEDDKLRTYVQRYGHWNWRELPKFAGLSRCGKSCRLRWMNYLRPDLKRGNYAKEEVDIIIKLHEELGKKWSMIAAKLPGRTDNEIKNYWHTHLKKRTKQRPTISDQEMKDGSGENSQCEAYQNKESEAKSVFLNTFSHPILESWTGPILESCPLSPETSCSEISSPSTETNPPAVSCVNWGSANDGRLASLEILEDSSGDFWTEPFVADSCAYPHKEYPLTLADGGFSSPYVSYHDDFVDFFYQVM